MNKKFKVFIKLSFISCLSILCFCFLFRLNIAYANPDNSYEGNNQSYKSDLPKNSEEVYSGKFAIDSDNDKVVAAYIKHCMDVVALEANSKKIKNVTSSNVSNSTQKNLFSNHILDNFLYYKISAEQNSKNTLHIANSDKGDYIKFQSDTVPWYDQRFLLNNVVVEDEIWPISTAAWFGCIDDDITGDVVGSHVQSFVGMNKIHLSKDASFMFTGCVFDGKTGTIDGLPQGLENVLLADSMFDYTYFPDGLLQSAIYGLKNATNRYYCFANNLYLTKAVLDTDNNIKNQTVNFSYMFRGDSNLTVVEGVPKSLNLDSSFKGMFRLCAKLTKMLDFQS